VFLSIDANRSYTPMQAIKVITQMEKWASTWRAADQGGRRPRDGLRPLARADADHGDEGVRTPAEAARLIEAAPSTRSPSSSGTWAAS